MENRIENFQMRTLAHDIRGMLASAQLIVDSMKLRNGRYDDQKCAKLEDIVDRVSMYCADIMNRPSARNGDNPSVLSVVQEVIQDCSPITSRNGIAVALDLDEFRLPIEKKAKLHRILMNLMRNSLQAMQRSGGTSLNLKGRKHRKRYDIDLSDDGPGLPPSVVDFLLASALYLQPGEETHVGLGLPSSIAAAHNIGGSLQLLRTGPTGSTLRLSLPIE